MTKAEAFIVVDHLRKSFKKTSVLRDVSFTVNRGTVFALLGPNGSGKTTLINILTTLIKADGGSASVGGHDVSRRPGEVRKHISLTGQFTAIDDMLTARENLVLISELRHVDNPAHVAESLLGQFDLTEAADRRTATFSGGMRRRLDISMSLIGEPAVIFLDEPTTGLDPEGRNQMWETIRTLTANGTTVFLTTQYLDEADQLADKIAILGQGRIVAEGTARELKELLPNGLIELRFNRLEQVEMAEKCLAEYEFSRHGNTQSLTINTDGSVAQIARLFKQLDEAHIEVAEFYQKTPTLDDAFLKILEESKGEGGRTVADRKGGSNVRAS